MKKIIICIGLIFIFTMTSVNLYSQYYNYTQTTGQSGFLYYFRGLASHIMTPPKDNQLSSWQQIPFEWDFYGHKMTGYYISDNGYITFDTNARVSKSQNKDLADTSVQKNAIYAFWNDHHLEAGNSTWTNEVATATIGNTPQRIHVIYWMGVVPYQESYSNSFISFCIALHEEGGFDIIFTTCRKSKDFTGTVGAVNQNGIDYVTTTASPLHIFPSVGLGDSDDDSYLFRRPSSISENYPDFSMKFLTKSARKGTIQFSLKKQMYLNISLYNLKGQQIIKLYDQQTHPGYFEIDISKFLFLPKNGAFILIARNEKNVLYRKLITIY